MYDKATIVRYDAIITGRTGTLSGSPPAADPATVLYDYAVVTPGVRLSRTGVLPIRRISVGAHVVPAEPPDPCEVVIVNQTEYLYVREGIAFQEACP